MAPPGTRVFSAGSEPSVINPFAVRALTEIGVSSNGQFSKGVEDIPAAEIDCVITLCAEEVCPVFPGDTVQLHWPLPDPAAAVGADDWIMASFRAVREEISNRLEGFFEAAF